MSENNPFDEAMREVNEEDERGRAEEEQAHRVRRERATHVLEVLLDNWGLAAKLAEWPAEEAGEVRDDCAAMLLDLKNYDNEASDAKDEIDDSTEGVIQQLGYLADTVESYKKAEETGENN